MKIQLTQIQAKYQTYVYTLHIYNMDMRLENEKIDFAERNSDRP